MARPSPRRLRALCAILLAIALTGCWNRREVNEVAIVSAAAIDRGKTERLRLTVQFVRPGTLSGGQLTPASEGSRVFMLAAEGNTLGEALERLSHELPRPPGWEHNNVLIFSEEIARDGLSDLLDFFVRNRWSRLDQWVLVARGEADAMLSSPNPLESNTGLALRRVYRHTWIESGKVAPARLNEFLVSLFTAPAAPIAGVIEHLPPELQPPEPPALPPARIGGAAIFRGDKLAGFLTDREARGMMWVRSRVAHGTVTVPCRRAKLEGISVQILQSRAQIVPEWRQGALPRVRIPIKVSARLGGQMCQEDLSKPDALEELGRRTAVEIEKEIARVLPRLQQELKADPLQVGEALHRAYPGRWPEWKDRWEEVFAKLSITPEVSVEMVQTGTSVGKPLPSK